SARLIEEALDRPDLTQAQFQVDSAQQRLSAAQRGMKPTLSGSAGYDWSGTVTPLDRSWSVGMQLSMPVLDGKLTRYSIDEQRSNLEQVRSTRDQRRLAVRAEVETAITGVRDAFHRLEASEVLLKEAGESLSLAEGRFDAGLGSPIEITDARAAFSSARGSHVTAYYDSLIALTNLDQVLGLLPAEAGGLSGWTAGAVTDEPASEPEPGSISANITTAASGTIEINQETARVSSESIVVPTATDTTDTGSEVKR
ncbi:MAG TPA: TolC family protein, partial [Candidatus Ozemobacteraceae bacterium]|nr:TolC family protein [Candidatus Ozemobacteraceae bacterium]